MSGIDQKRYLVTVALCLLAAACGDDSGKTKVDSMLVNGRVLTLDHKGTVASVVVVGDGRIVAVGGEELVETYEAQHVTDLQGRLLLPGFVDSHTHIRGEPKRYIDLTQTRSIHELQQQVTDKARELGQGEWITGYGWSEDVMAELRRPLRADLDAAAPDNPVYLLRAGGHSAAANSRALEIAGVDGDTPDPDGGLIERDSTGELNGIIREPGEIVSRFIPEASNDEVRESLVGMLQDQLGYGITSLVHATGTIADYPEWERIYREHTGRLPRATVQLAWEGSDAMAAFGRKTGDGNEFLKVGAVKIFVDGGFTGPAAYTKEPYRGEADYRGKLNLTVEELRRIINEAHSAGWQLGIHAIGDAAIELTVDELVVALKNAPRPDHRHYLNHFTVMPSIETMLAMAENEISITQQPNFTYTLEGRYSAYLDGDRLQHNNPLRTPMDLGIHVAISSDILPIGPMVGIQAAVTRKGMSGQVYGKEEALTVVEALRAYTALGAWLTFDERQTGTIESGKFADMIVLDQDITSGDPDHIVNTRVLQTWLGGKLVYQRQ
ncbi:MAG TPA: amidohydrolase [Woeseiaceae bacterium]|nr:amidohydrolase [Woeseiaceae bacterium]